MATGRIIIFLLLLLAISKCRIGCWFGQRQIFLFFDNKKCNFTGIHRRRMIFLLSSATREGSQLNNLNVLWLNKIKNNAKIFAAILKVTQNAKIWMQEKCHLFISATWMYWDSSTCKIHLPVQKTHFCRERYVNKRGTAYNSEKYLHLSDSCTNKIVWFSTFKKWFSIPRIEQKPDYWINFNSIISVSIFRYLNELILVIRTHKLFVSVIDGTFSSW